MAKKNLFAPIKINTTNILLNRPGKIDGRIAEVRRGTGVIIDAKHKKQKYKEDYHQYVY